MHSRRFNEVNDDDKNWGWASTKCAMKNQVCVRLGWLERGVINRMANPGPSPDSRSTLFA